jgi:hypothetical protein
VIDLSKVSTDALLAELVRRRNAKPPRAVEHYCDACLNFKPWNKRGDAPDDYNPCGMGHRMSFRMPEDHEGPHGAFGYYRRVCSDRRA